MSKINAVRFINLNYNNNSIRISDEVFQLNGESTLLSLRNGGGKSVLVQMMTAPFVHKRYRDAKDRPFDSYFTTNKPTFILVEWVLDQGAGSVLTGMMVRKSQEISEQQADSLEIINIISEYKEPCGRDIYHLPVVEKTGKELILKNFGTCRQLFESFKKDHRNSFTYYDMNNAAQSRQYFEKLKEYQIDYKEWETIIKKVNLKESGLSDLFADCRDEKGLVEKWFLDAVESKLNKDRNRMKEFQTIVEKYVGQYKDNQSKIERRDTIRLFKEEAGNIQEKAQDYLEAANREKDMENRIANFIKELEELEHSAREEKEAKDLESSALAEEITYMEYEKLSQEIHALAEKERYHTSNRDMIGMERDDLEREYNEIQRLLNLYACAKCQEELDEEQRDFSQAQQRLAVFERQEEELEPERQSLGYGLKRYYQEQIKENQGLEEQKNQQMQNTLKQIKSQKEKILDLKNQQKETTRQIGATTAEIQGFNEKESNFNNKYHEDLNRNILGEYEPGELDIRMRKYESRLEALQRELRNDNKQLEQSRETMKTAQRALQDSTAESIRTQGKKLEIEKERNQLEEELRVRKSILRYFDKTEDELFETDAILTAAERKLQEISSVKRHLEKEEDELQKEYIQLTQGKVLELPKDFEELLNELGLHYVFGMDWLKRNEYSVQQNQELIRRIPFLPYGLILSHQELEKLSEYGKEVYTSFPIPIIIRETLEAASAGGDGNIIHFSQVSFYVFFNENLLDEEKLTQLVTEKEEQLKKKQTTIAIKKTEYENYFEKKERIRNQRINRKLYEETEENYRHVEEELVHLEDTIRRKNEEILELDHDITMLKDKIQKADRERDGQMRSLEAYRELCASYEIYMEQRRQLEKLQKQIKRAEEQDKLAAGLLEKLEEERWTLQSQYDGILRDRDSLQRSYAIYADYEEPKSSMLEAESPSYLCSAESFDHKITKEQITDMEARYQAITSQISATLKDLEEQVKNARKRYEKVKEELHEKSEKYHVNQDEWKMLSYIKREERHQESLLEDKRIKIKIKDTGWNAEDKNAAIVTQQIKERKQTLQQKFAKEEPIPKAEIRTLDFEARMNELKYQKMELMKQQKEWEDRLHNYEDHLLALSEYSHFPVVAQITFEKNLKDLDKKELRNFKGILIRNYKEETQGKLDRKGQLEQLLNQIVRKEEFQENFYRKPLESLLELTYDASQVISQLSTTVESYNRLMEKLEVDIFMVEKEKQKIVEILGDYIEEVHLNLDKIDTNSTITIRERPIKMLKIQLPDWEENENLYQVRLQDFIDELTEKGIEIYEHNENAQEYFGAKMTTRNLYDTIIGIGNVQIRLYKIEEQREYPITWSECAKNSGGEGFLSAFIILSSLLYYMRKDDSDIFANKNEGKVLVMDNPFAQTNAAHLLKPLMDMAKKTNTQLICLSGLGGESIYNRFDNIYVLNLIAASLRNGMQYLKVKHLRGSEEETMVVSQIEVQQQLTLF